jgi:hypothetical protein
MQYQIKRADKLSALLGNYLTLNLLSLNQTLVKKVAVLLARAVTICLLDHGG